MFTAQADGGANGSRQPLFSPPGASFLPPNARNPLGQPAVRGGLQGGGETAPLLGGGGGGQQQQALMVPQQDQYLSSRADALHQVESTIVELGSIFQQLAHMVRGLGGWMGECKQRPPECPLGELSADLHGPSRMQPGWPTNQANQPGDPPCATA